jgi:threonylcarbamoyladenosine tRNA methylthiotransferase MtaB
MHPDLALELPGVRQVVPNHEKNDLVPDLLSLDRDIFDLEPIERVPIPGNRHKTRGFIKVQDGCRHACAFCVTTIARGGSYSIPRDRVIKEIKAACQAGIKEVVLTGVQLGSWGADLEPTLFISDLVKEILKRTEIPRLRLSSLEPWDVSSELIDLMLEDRVARHFHLPLQSGSAAVMRRMARAITPLKYRKLIQTIRKTVPGVAITTDILTGFPGETDAEFHESLEFIQEMEFADGHVFTYSAREGTAAFGFPDQVPHPIRKERNAMIRATLAEDNLLFRGRFVGEEMCVLWERSKINSKESWSVTGLTDNYIKVEAEADLDLWNEFSIAGITDTTSDGVQAKIILS